MDNELYRMLLVTLVVCFNSRIHLFDKELSFLGGYREWLWEYFFAAITTTIIFVLLLAWWPSFHFPIFSWKTCFHFYIPLCAFFGFFWTATCFNTTESEDGYDDSCGCVGIRCYETGLSVLLNIIYIITIFVYITYWIISGIINIMRWLF